MRVTILGSGSSSGVPMPGLGWGACDPENPRNTRLRPSIFIEDQHTKILVDTSPDLRQQLLNSDINHIDGVIYTHAHADHLHGIDDLRGINRAMEAPIEAFGTKETLKEINDRFGYVLKPLPQDAKNYYFKPTLQAHGITAGDDFCIGPVKIQTFDQDHGLSRTMGLRIGNTAYTTDLVELPEASFAKLAGIKTWIIGVFTDVPHPTHVHVDKALEWVERVKPDRTIFCHLSLSLDYESLSQKLPEHVEVGYDGMILDNLD